MNKTEIKTFNKEELLKRVFGKALKETWHKLMPSSITRTPTQKKYGINSKRSIETKNQV